MEHLRLVLSATALVALFSTFVIAVETQCGTGASSQGACDSIAEVSTSDTSLIQLRTQGTELLTHRGNASSTPPVTKAGCTCMKSWSFKEYPPCTDYCCNPDGDAGGDWCNVEDFNCEGKFWGTCAGPSQDESAKGPEIAEEEDVLVPASTSQAPTVQVTTTQAPTTTPVRQIHQWEWDFFVLVNKLRASGATCQNNKMPDLPAPEYSLYSKASENKTQALPLLQFDCRLFQAAEGHSRDMADNDFYSTTFKDGQHFQSVVEELGLTASGLDIAAGSKDPELIIKSILADDQMCTRHLMVPETRLIGIGWGYNENSQYKDYWTAIESQSEDTPETACYLNYI